MQERGPSPENPEFAPTNPEKDAEVVDSLTRDQADQSIAQFVPSKSAEQVRAMGLASSFGHLVEKSYAEAMDPANDFMGYVDRGSVGALFINVLASKHPELGVSLRSDEVEDKDYLTIGTTPYKTDKELVRRLMAQPIMDFLIKLPSRSNEISLSPDRYGEAVDKARQIGLSQEGAEAVIAWAIEQKINNLDNLKKTPADEQEIRNLKASLADLNVSPATEEEVSNMISSIIDQEFGK